MRQDILFYSFMTIFIVTALVTLLGVVGTLPIGETQLNMLLGAFLVELAGAVVGLYKRTEFFSRSADNIASSLGTAIEAFDQISDEIAATINDRQPDPNHVHRFLIKRSRDGIVAYEKMCVITADELEKLPKDQRELVRSYEKSMQKLKKEWHKLKRGDVDAQLDPQIRAKNLELIASMKENLVGILNFLEQQHIYLDDHYIDVRALVSQLKPEGVLQKN